MVPGRLTPSEGSDAMRLTLLSGLLALPLCVAAQGGAFAQTVSPVIAEYTAQASGSFEVTNNSLVPVIVVLEPMSFNVGLEGDGQFRPLDANVHLELSATSFRLEPHQAAHIFYKATAANVPAWLCIYASFSGAKKGEGVNLRIMVPHTIYIYQKQPLSREAIDVHGVHYDAELHRVVCELTNNSSFAGRAESVEVTGKRSSFATVGGFPMLPQGKRLLSIPWTSEQRPEKVEIQFDHFLLKLPVED